MPSPGRRNDRGSWGSLDFAHATRQGRRAAGAHRPSGHGHVMIAAIYAQEFLSRGTIRALLALAAAIAAAWFF